MYLSGWDDTACILLDGRVRTRARPRSKVGLGVRASLQPSWTSNNLPAIAAARVIW